jgi:predicted Zn-dependent protease
LKKKRHANFVIRGFHVPLALFVLQLFLVDGSAFALSIEDETKIGQQFSYQVKRHFELVQDEDANRYFRSLGHYLLGFVGTRPFTFHFNLIRDNTLNAFAGPGGHIFFFTGLIEVMDEVDELAAVLSHEIGHVTARHISKRIEKQKKMSFATIAGMLAGALLGGGAGMALATGSQAAAAQAQLHYSRMDERQADHLSFEYMKSSGFDPSGMISTLKKIDRGHLLGTDRVPTYLLTHPTGPERMSNLDAMMASFRPGLPKDAAHQFRALFPFFRTICRAQGGRPEEAKQHFERELSRNPQSSLAHYGLGLLYRDASEYDLAIEHFKQSLNGDVPINPVLRRLGEAFQMKGNDREAIGLLEKALKYDKDDRSAQFLLALSYENLEKYEQAIPLLERLCLWRAVRAEVYYHLGICYGRLNRLALAHYNFGIYFKRIGKMEKARFHFQKANELGGKDPGLGQRIQKEMQGLSVNR